MEKVGLIGGTGDLGTALAIHIAKAYERVLVGSRNRDKAETAVRTIISESDKMIELESRLVPATNVDVVVECDILVVTVPYESAMQTIRDLIQDFRGNQLLISAAASLTKVENNEFSSDTGSKPLAVSMREILPRSIKVATAFQTVPANVLYKAREIMNFDVLVACEDREAYSRASAFINSIPGFRALNVGSLDQAGQVEGLTSILLNIAIRNKLRSPTFRVESF